MTTIAKRFKGFGSAFFGAVSSGLQEGVATIGEDVLPIWVTQQLGVQMKDQLRAPTFNPNTAKPRVEAVSGGTRRTALATAQTAQPGAVQDVGSVSFGGLSQNQLLLAGGGVLLLVLLVPMLSRRR